MSNGSLPWAKENLTDLRRRGGVPDTSRLANDIKDFDIRALAERVFGDAAKADAWFRRPNASMSGQLPLDLLKDALGTAVVRETLEQIDNGIFA